MRDLDDLAAVLGGRLFKPGDAGWDDARSAWQLLADQRPAAVVLAAGPHDVALTVRSAAALGLRVAPQSTGHNPRPLGDLSRTILLRTTELTAITVDSDTRTAALGAGATAGQLAARAAEHGLVPILGCAATVGIVGLVLSGGLGWFARSHGTGVEHVEAFDVVTPDGVARRAERGGELFDAIAAGADIAVVTGLTLRLHAIAAPMGGALFWPIESASEVFRAWRRWTRELPDAVTSIVRTLRVPPAPGVPPHLAGRAFAVVEAVIQEDEAATDALLQGLRALGPEFDTFGRVPPPALAGLHMDPPVPSAALGGGALLADVPDAVLDDLADAVTRGPARVLTSLEVRHLGGALDRGAESATGGAAASVYGVAVAADPAATQAPSAAAIGAARDAMAAIAAAVAPVRAGRELRGFTEAPAEPERLFGSRLPSLRRAKLRWDPRNLVHAAHSVGDPISF